MKIKNLTKSFDKKLIFDNFSVEFPENEVTYVMGESGCGKTTLLRIIAGIDNDFSGEIEALPNNISYVFQEPRLFPNLNVIKNIELVNDTPVYSASELLNLLELGNEELTMPSKLSGGMKMRLSLARALYHNGDVYLMDEPFSALDQDMKNRLIPKVLELLKGKTVIIVSHDIDEAKKYADKIITLA